MEVSLLILMFASLTSLLIIYSWPLTFLSALTFVVSATTFFFLEMTLLRATMGVRSPLSLVEFMSCSYSLRKGFYIYSCLSSLNSYPKLFKRELDYSVVGTCFSGCSSFIFISLSRTRLSFLALPDWLLISMFFRKN